MAQAHINFLNAISFQILKLKIIPCSTPASQQLCAYGYQLFGSSFYATTSEMEAFLKSNEAWLWKQKGYSDFDSEQPWSECADIAANLGATNLEQSFRTQAILLY
ncbi:hypothetical protein [Pseudomonas monteilii]|uniref:hypothetical protein n=1 Tax=Pseudomonas monteilii TaxID=76759 RepID=UPI003D96B372